MRGLTSTLLPLPLPPLARTRSAAAAANIALLLPPPLLLLLLLAHGPSSAAAAKVALVPLSSDSHIAAFLALAAALQDHGSHAVTMVVSEQALAATQRTAAGREYDYITYPLDFTPFLPDMARIAQAGFVRSMFFGHRVLAGMMGAVVGSEPLKNELSTLAPDLIIGDAVGAYGQWLSAALGGVPSVEFDVGTSGAMLASQHGGQLPAYIPAPGTFYPSAGMSLGQRVVNAAVIVATKVVNYAYWHYGPVNSLARRHGLPRPGSRGAPRPLLLLVNFDFALEPPRPVAPNTVYVGPLMPRAPAPLPPDLQTWLDGGGGQVLPVVYVSFGASFLAPDAAMKGLARALAACRGRLRFLLRLRAPEEAALAAALAADGAAPLAADEALVRERVPQNDVLAHLSVAAFVTQGGYLSMQEAAWHAVPVVGVPFTLGQGELVAYARDQGRGALVRKEALMRGDGAALAAALLAVAAPPRAAEYERRAAVAAARLRAHPRTPAERAADAVAFALAQPRGGGSYLHTAGQDMDWWQVIMLDVLSVYVLGLAAACWAVRALWLQARGRRLSNNNNNNRTTHRRQGRNKKE